MSTPPNKQVIPDESHDNSNTDIINKLESECLQKDLERIKLANTMLKNENKKLIIDLKHYNQLLIQKDYTIELKDYQISAFHKSEQDQYQTQLYETQQQLTYYFNESIRQNSKIQQLMISIQSMKFDHKQEINDLNNSLIRAQKLKFRQTNINNTNVTVENNKLFEENLKLKQMIKELEDVNNVRLDIIRTLKKQNEIFVVSESVCHQKCDNLQQQLLQKDEIIISANDKIKLIQNENIWFNQKIKELQCNLNKFKSKYNQLNAAQIVKNNEIKQLKLVNNIIINKCNQFNQLIDKKEININGNISVLCGKIKRLQDKIICYKNVMEKRTKIKIINAKDAMEKQIKKEKLNNSMEICVKKEQLKDINVGNTVENAIEICDKMVDINVNDDINKINNGKTVENAIEICVKKKGVNEMEICVNKINNGNTVENAIKICDKMVNINEINKINNGAKKKKRRKKNKNKNKKKRTFEESESNNKLLDGPLNKRRKIIKKECKKIDGMIDNKFDVDNKLNVLWKKDDLVTGDTAKELEEDNIYVVDEILSHKVINKTKNKYKYKVKWYGYDQLTWEPESHLNPYTITQYWQKQKQ